MPHSSLLRDHEMDIAVEYATFRWPTTTEHMS